MRGSTTLLTDENGRVTDRYQYGLFGEVEHIEGATYQPFQYNGRDGVVTDRNGLYDMRTRFYNPVLKRFLQRDIWPGRLEETQSLNRYAYVQGNPVSFIDPLGLSCKNVMPSPEGTGNVKFPDLYSNWKWDVPKSLPTFGHAYSKHGSHIPDAKLKARAINDKVQIGRWDNQKDAAKLISEVAKQGPGVYDIKLPSNVGGTSFLKTGEKVLADRAIIVVREDNSITSAYPYNSSHPTKPER